MWSCSFPCVNTQKTGLQMDGTKVATNGTASALSFFKNAPREAKLRPIVGSLVLPTPSSRAVYDASGSQSSSPTSPDSSSSYSIDKTDNHDTFGFNPGAPDMRREDERLKSFDRWPVSFISAQILAQNGFYYLGRGDEVRCAFCKVEIMKWVEGDDPVKDHQRWGPQCPIVRKMNVASAAPEEGRDECGSRTPPPAPPRMPGPKYPRYATEAARLKSFTDWPRSIKQKPEELVEAGFYYTGTGDKTKCFYCGGGLKDWEEDDVPWEQHARWFDRCAYVQLVKGREYVQKVMTEACAIQQPPEVEKRPEESSMAAETTEAPGNNVDDSKLCKICFAEERNVCFVPCGHVVACAKCALSTDKCPMCRRTFQNAVRLYFS